jgi:hypothetical protein
MIKFVEDSMLTENPEKKSNFDLPPLDKSKFLEEQKTVSSLEYKNMIKTTAVIVIYSAAAVASSTGLILIPNLETITIFIFLVSFYYGFKIGLPMMITTVIIYELFASIAYGFGGPLIVFKMIGYLFNVIVASYLGNISKDVQKNEPKTLLSNNFSIRLGFMITGILLTVVYDIVTTFYTFLILQDIRTFTLFVIPGLPFIFFHEITNGIIFFFTLDYIRMIKLSNNANFTGTV